MAEIEFLIKPDQKALPVGDAFFMRRRDLSA